MEKDIKVSCSGQSVGAVPNRRPLRTEPEVAAAGERAGALQGEVPGICGKGTWPLLIGQIG